MTTQRRFQHSSTSDNFDSGPVSEEIMSRLRTADGDWKDYADALRDLTIIATAVKKRRPYSPDENKALLQQIRSLAPSFALFIGDLRSSLVKEVCCTVTTLSEIFGASFVAQIDVQVIPALLKRTCTSKAVIRDTAKSTAVSLFKNGLPAISNPVALLLRDTIRNRKAAPGMRQAASQFVGMFLVEPTSAPSPAILSALEESILAGVEDPDEAVRSQSRENWLRLAALDEPTAAALLERISFHVVPHLEEAFEDEYGRRLENEEVTLTQTLPLTAFDRPVRAGQADSFHGRPGPVRAAVHTKSLHCSTSVSATDYTRNLQEGRERSAAPVRARVRPSTIARTADNAMGSGAPLTTSRGNEPSALFPKYAAAFGSAMALPPENHTDHSRIPARPFRTALPSRTPDTTSVPPSTISSHTRSYNPLPPTRPLNAAQPIRAHNGPMPVRANSAAPPIRTNDGPRPKRASGITVNWNHSNPSTTGAPNNSLPGRVLNESAPLGAADSNLAPEVTQGTEVVHIPYDSQPVCSPSGVSTFTTELKAEQELVSILPSEDPETSKIAVEQTRQDGDPENVSVSASVASVEPSSEDMAFRQPTLDPAFSQISGPIDSFEIVSTGGAIKDEPVAQNSSVIKFSSKSSHSAQSSLLSTTSSVEQNNASGEKDVEDGFETSLGPPAMSSPQQESEIVLDKGRLSFILGTNITPRKPMLRQWARSRFDMSNSDNFSSPESMGRLSGEVGLSIALGESTELFHVANTAQRKQRGISAPDLDSDLDRTPGPTTKKDSGVQVGVEVPANKTPVEVVVEGEKALTEVGAAHSVVSVAQEERGLGGDCNSVHQDSAASASENIKNGSLTRPKVYIGGDERSINVDAAKITNSGDPTTHGGQFSASYRQLGDTAKGNTLKGQHNMESIRPESSATANQDLDDGRERDMKSDTKKSQERANRVTSNSLRMRRVTTANGAPVLGKDRLVAKSYRESNLSKESFSRRPPRHSVMPVTAAHNQKSTGTLGTVRSSTRTTNSGVSRLTDRVGPMTVRATLSTRLPRSVVAKAGQKALESCPSKNGTSTVDEKSGAPQSLATFKANPGSETDRTSTQLQKPMNCNMVITKATTKIAPSRSHNPNVSGDKMATRGESSKAARISRLTTNDVYVGRTGKENRRDMKIGKLMNVRATTDSKGKEETPPERLQSAMRKLRSVIGRGRGDWCIRLERMKDVKESLQCIDRDNLNARVAEDCVLIIGEMVNDGHHRVVVAALDSLFLLLLRVEGEAESGALQKMLERKADVLRKVLHLCKDSKEDIRLACQRVLQSFEVQFAPEAQVGLLLRAMGIETGRGGKARKSSVRIGYSTSSATVGSEVRVLESGCRSLVKAYERAERCEGGFVWSPVMLEMMLVGMAKLTKDKHVEIRRGADGVVKAVQSSLPDGAFDLACQRYGVKFACMESDGNDRTDDNREEK